MKLARYTIGAKIFGAFLAMSALIVVRLQRLLRRIGAEVCERGGASTEFWIAYTQLMMFVAPLLLVAYFSRAGFYYLRVMPTGEVLRIEVKAK